MKVLGLDTALNDCSVAVIEGDSVLAAQHVAGPRGQAERLLPMALAVLEKAGLGFAAIDRIGVTVGPGSFSGIRIGLAAARGLALVMGRPLVGITTLRAIAAGVPAKLRAGRVVAVTIEARRGDAYTQVFDADLAPLGEPVLLPKAEVARSFGGRDVVLAGDAASAVRELASNRERFIVAEGTNNPDAIAVARLAAQRLGDGTMRAAPAALFASAGGDVSRRVSATEAVRVEAAGATRLAALSALHGACFTPGWSSESVARLLATPGAQAWLAWTPPEAPEPCGFALARAGGGECELISIGVLATRRRQGVGPALVGAWLDWAKAEGAGRCFLEVAEDNHAARALYAGLGFIEVGRRPGYYGRGQVKAPALVLSLALEA